MHRSATSLAASVLRHAGLDIGSRLNGSGPGNPRGHFEDYEVWRLHDEMLAAAGYTALSVDDEFAAPLDERFEQRAAAFVASRAGKRAWGWKDPRTCLFLGLWHRVVPHASYLVLYRHPADVALSLLRRNTEPDLWENPRQAFDLWSVHNRRIVDLVERKRGRCFVAHATAFTSDLGTFVRALADRFELPLQPAGVDSLYSPRDLSPPVDERERPPWERIVPDALELFRWLESVADLPSVPPRPEALRSADVSEELIERSPDELRLAENLLFNLVESRALRRQQRVAAEAFAQALEGERARHAETQRAFAAERELAARQRCRADEMEARHLDSSARRDELAAMLASIERSRAHALVRGWWRLTSVLRSRDRSSGR
jgi:sulfotransferase family protein